MGSHLQAITASLMEERALALLSPAPQACTEAAGEASASASMVYSKPANGGSSALSISLRSPSLLFSSSLLFSFDVCSFRVFVFAAAIFILRYFFLCSVHVAVSNLRSVYTAPASSLSPQLGLYVESNTLISALRCIEVRTEESEYKAMSSDGLRNKRSDVITRPDTGWRIKRRQWLEN